MPFARAPGIPALAFSTQRLTAFRNRANATTGRTGHLVAFAAFKKGLRFPANDFSTADWSNRVEGVLEIFGLFSWVWSHLGFWYNLGKHLLESVVVFAFPGKKAQSQSNSLVGTASFATAAAEASDA
jgi:hypothetical protein